MRSRRPPTLSTVPPARQGILPVHWISRPVGGPSYREAKGGDIRPQPFWQARYYDFNVWSEQKTRREAALHSPQPSKAWIGGAPRGLVMEQLSSLSHRRRGSSRDRIALDSNQTREARNLFHGSATRPSLRGLALRFTIGQATRPQAYHSQSGEAFKPSLGGST